MTRRTRLIAASAAAVAVAGVVAAGIVLAGGDGGHEPVPVATGRGNASSVEGQDVVAVSGKDPVSGAQVALSDYEGRPVVLNFWASWCPPCREELPALDQLAKKHPEVAVVGVNYQDGVSGARKLQRELGWTFPSIADPFGELAARLGLQGMPTTYFLDADHRVAGVIVGGADLAGFEKGVELVAGDGQ
jgi:thiol-disulfide isomerase/thioredoxin